VAVSNTPRNEAVAVQWVCYACNEEDERQLEALWEELALGVEANVSALSDAIGPVRLAVERSDEEEMWEISAAVHLTGRTLFASGSGSEPRQAMEKAVNDIAEQIDRYEEKPDVVGRRRELKGVAVMLDAWRSRGWSHAFVSFITPVVGSLSPYVARELKLHEAEGNRPADGIQKFDMLDEMLVLAWEQFPQRDPHLPLDLWLVRLADQAIEKMLEPVTEESLDDRRPWPSGEPAESVRDQWVEQVTEPETISLAEVLSDEPSAEAWDRLDVETKEARLAELLRDIPRQSRQTFLLNLAHGFTTGEIADFQNRSEDEVQNEISETTAGIRRRFVEDTELQREEDLDRADMQERRRR